LKGHISDFIMYSRDTVGMLHHKQTWPSWYIVWNFGTWSILEWC